MYVHCGFDNSLIDFAGRLWEPISLPQGSGNQAPATFVDPLDSGTITLVGSAQAVYLSQADHSVLLRPVEGFKDIAPCY